MEVSSTYQSVEGVAKFRALYDVSGTFNESDVILEPVEAGEYVTCVPSSEPAFFYMYTRFIEDFHLYFPFKDSPTWTTSPRLIRGAIYERLSEFERDTVAYPESLNQMSPRDLLDAESAPAVLENYLSKLFYKFLWLPFSIRLLLLPVNSLWLTFSFPL
jgi:hypothetical protein